MKHNRPHKEPILTRLASFPEFNPNPLVETDLSGFVTYINPICKRLFPDVEKTGFEHPYLTDIASIIESEFREKGKTVYDREIKTGDKWYKQIICHVKPERRIRVYGFDITQRREMEEKLRESEENFRGYFENVGIGAAQIDKLGRFIRVNDCFCQITGYSREELLGGMGPMTLNHPDDQETDKKLIAQFLEGEMQQYENEKRYIRKDGSIVWVHVNATPVRDTNGHILYTAGIIQDITERKNAEQILQKMQFIISEGQKIAHLGSWEYIVDSQETVWSEEEFRIYGISPGPHSPSYEDLLKKHIHPDDVDLLDKTFKKTLHDGTVFELEHRIVHPDGSVRFMYNRAYPYFDETGKLLRYIGATLDITERKQIEAERNRVIAELQSALAQVKQLRGLLPVCVWCKNVRNDEGYWQQIEEYIAEHSEATFTHGICPECAEKVRRKEE